MRTQNKALKITEIATNLKKNHSTIKKYLDVLINLKLIKIEKEKKRDVFKFDSKKYSKVKNSLRSV